MGAAWMILGGAFVLLSSFFIVSEKTDPVKKDELPDSSVQTSSVSELARFKVTLEEELGRGERELEKLTNEKIMAVEEYSATVLEQIRRNHQETMFLYNMLNDKHEELKKNLRDVNSVSDRRATHKDKATETSKAQAKKGRKASGEKKPSTGSVQERVLELGACGRSDVEIARELGMGVGEVRLILNLRRAEEARAEEGTRA